LDDADGGHEYRGASVVHGGYASPVTAAVEDVFDLVGLAAESPINGLLEIAIVRRWDAGIAAPLRNLVVLHDLWRFALSGGDWPQCRHVCARVNPGIPCY